MRLNITGGEAVPGGDAGQRWASGTGRTRRVWRGGGFPEAHSVFGILVIHSWF
jgi:hypothetical protein